MNRIAALVITTILLTQIASYSYGEITPQVEWEEPLQGDPDWKVTGRNSTSNNSNNESVWGESFETYDSNTGGTYSEIVWEAYNLANDTSYNVSFDLYEYDNSTSGLTLLYSVANMTIFNSSYYYFNYSTTNSTADGFWTTSGTSDGCYYVEINLRNASTAALYSSYGFDWAVNEYCGDEYLDIDHSGYVWETPSLVEVWDSGTDVHVQFTSGNLEVGESYQLIWNLSEWWGSNQPAAGNVTWNATSNSSVENSTISGLANGTYFFQATLKKNNLVVAQDWTMIQMGNNTTTGGNNTGGNNTGGNNSGCGSDANLSELELYMLEPANGWTVGGTFDVRLQTNCNLVDKHKKVHGFVEDPSSNIIYFAHEYNTTATNPSNGTIVIDLSNIVTIPSLGLGTYWIYSEFDYKADNGSWTHLDWAQSNFTVTNNTTGGNNSGGNNTGGNNTGGNNTGGNNTGGNNTGGVGTNPGNPIMPMNCTRIDWNLTTNVTVDDCINGTSAFWFEFNNTGGIVWIDPEVAIGYDYEVFSSHLITHITIPSGYGDNVFDLYLRDTNGLWYDSGENIFGGQTYTLNSPVSAMSIRGIEATAMLSPTDPNAFVSGLTFDSNGTVVMTMTPVIGNYTCGVDNELIQLYVYTNSMTYQLGDVVDVWYAVNCTINGVEYEMEVVLNNNNHHNWNWTETDNYFSNHEELTNLSVGSYCLNATLFDLTSMEFITFELACFEVIDTTGGNNTGGNNTGGNNTGWNNCGNATNGWNLTDLRSWTNDYFYEVGENVYFNWYVNCTVIDENYTLNATVYNEDDGAVHGDYNYAWTATSTTWSESEHEPLPVGDYCMNSTLSSNGILIEFEQVCFSVYPPMPVVYGWPEYYEYEFESDNLTMNWSANDLMVNASVDYLVTIIINDGNNDTVWSDEEIIQNPQTAYQWGSWTIPGNTLTAGCYYALVRLYEYDIATDTRSVVLDHDNFIFSVAYIGGNCDGDGNNTNNPLSYYAINGDNNDCLTDGENLTVHFYITGNAGHVFTLQWQVLDSNSVGSTYSQDITLDSLGVGYFMWELDTTGWSDGTYSVRVESSGTFFDELGFYFDIGCSGCGYDLSLINGSYQIWSSAFGTIYSTWADENGSSSSTNDDTPQIFPGDTLGAYFQITCLTHGEDYLANLTITNDANLVVYSDERTFTQSHWSNWYSYSEQGISTDLLPAGEYCVTFTLYVSPFGSADVVYTVTNCVEVVDLDDWDGCGTNITYVDHEHEVNGNPFVEQGLVFLTTSNVWYNNFVDCLVIGESYTMTTNITFEGAPYSEETENFTVYQFSDITQWSWGRVNLLDQSSWDWQELDAGNYCVETTIHSTDSTYTNLIAMVSTETDCFAVVEVTDNWADDWWDDQTNNTTGSPNNPIMPDTNCTNLSSSLTGLNLTNAFNMSDCENGTGFWFNLTVNGTGVNWYDPVYAVGYDFEILSGPKFASVVVPPGYGDDKYDIYLWDGSEYVLAASDLDALTQYWFTDDGQITTTPGDYDGITMFSIRGLELDAKLDPDDPNAFVTGLTFVQDPNEVSEVVISMNPIRVSDEDDDGIADDDDNCINDANSDQADSDGDGVGDACETAAAGSDDDDKDDTSEEDSSNRTLAYAALLAVGLVAVLIMFGRENEK